jgi:hypothetical protein
VTRTARHDYALTASRRARRISAVSSGLVILLLAQYVLGIGYNLYGTAPTAAKPVKLFSSPLLAAHVVLGTLLIVVAIYLVAASIQAGMRIPVAASIIGLASLVAAWISGSAFTQKGTSGYSMAMGVLAAVALLCYLAIAKVLDARHGDRWLPAGNGLNDGYSSRSRVAGGPPTARRAAFAESVFPQLPGQVVEALKALLSASLLGGGHNRT